MKRIFTLVLAMVILNVAYGQSSVNSQGRHTTHRYILDGLLNRQQASHVAAKTTSGVSMERVIRQTTRNNSLGALNDSISIKYGMGRGSTYDYNTMIYAYNYPYNASPVFNYAGVFTTPQILFDTLYRWTIDPNTLTYGYYETDVAAYSGAHELTNYRALYADSSVYPNTISANTFSAGKISTGTTSNWVMGAVDSLFKQYYKYSSSGLLTEDSTYELHHGTWRIASKSYYTYDASNNLVQIDNYTNYNDTSFSLPLVENLRYINTYDASHRLLTVEADYHYLSGLSAYVKDTFAYSGTYNYHNSWKEYQYDTINHYWAPMFYMTKVINGLGLPDTVNIQSFDSLLNTWVPQTMDVIHYDAAHNPDTLWDYEYNFTAWPSTPDFTTIYYYEVYANTLGISQVPAADGVKIFPNPAAGMLYITQAGVKDNDLICMSLVNAQGQLVRRESTRWSGSWQIPVNDLAPGIYWVLLQDVGGNIIHRQAVVKQ